MRWHLILFFVPALAFAADPATFETRSQRYGLRIEVVAAGDAVQYAARVTDLATGEVLAAPRLEEDKESIIEVGDRTVRIHLSETDNGISASLYVEQGETLLDEIAGRWALKPGPLHVGGDVKAPVVSTRVEPRYPEEARRARISGIVILQAFIDKTGAVRDVHVLKPLPNGLSEAAADAVREWRFQPATRKGQPVGVLFNLTVNFKLEEKPRPPAQ